MKEAIIALFMLVCINSAAQQLDKEINVISFNVRYNSPNDGINVWENRKEWLCQSIKFFNGDVIGAQEVTYTQLKDMEALLPEYGHLGLGREGENRGEFSPVFYLKNRFKLLENNTFWLSDTPKKVGSKGWDASLPRIVTWAKFKDKEKGAVFYLFNTHFDHKGPNARKESAQLIAKEIERIAGSDPVVLTGDFNTPPDSHPYTILLGNGLKDSFLSVGSEQVYGPEHTANGWDYGKEGQHHRIDYVFYKGMGLRAVKYHVLDGQRGKRFISDHFPVIVKFKWD